MNAARLLFRLVLITVGLIGIGGAFTSLSFWAEARSRPRDRSEYKPSASDRWFMFAFCVAFLAYGVWIAIGAALRR